MKGGETEEWLLNEYGIFFGGDENEHVLEFDRIGGCTTLQID